MKTEIQPYKRAGGSSGINGGSIGWPLKLLQLVLNSWDMLLIYPFVFLLGRAAIAGGLMPFGLAAYASTLGMDINRLVAAAFILAGMVSNGAGEQLYITISGMILFNALNIPFKNNKSKNNIRFACIGFVSALIPQLVFAALQDFLLFDVLKAIFCSFIVFALMFVFRTAAGVVAGLHTKRLLSNEDVISIAIVLAIALSGLVDFRPAGFDIRNIFCILVIMVFCHRCGAGVGAGIGVVVGLLVSMSSEVTPLIIGSFAFCGLLGGLFGGLGKLGTGLGFVMGNALLTLYMNGSTEVIIYLKEIIAALVLFAIIPSKLVDTVVRAFGGSSGAQIDKRAYSTRIKEITVEKLNKYSRAFNELSKTFSEIAETRVAADNTDISNLFDRVADKVCRDCSLCVHCWDRNFYSTYQVLFKIVDKLDSKGRVNEEDIPGYFIDKCERINDFVKAVNDAYELFRVDMVWKNRIGESRGLVSQQLKGLSKVISNLALEINTDVNFNSQLEEHVMDQLAREGIRAEEVIVYENKWGKYEINIFHKGCNGRRQCVSLIEKVVSDAVGRKMTKEADECMRNPKGGSCSLKLVEEEAFSVITGIARVAKNNGPVSGDSYTFMNTGEGKYIAALSDGMGSGQKAANQSRATVSMLEQFLESGFDKDTTVKMINSLLVLKSNEESFTTIDLSMVDLYEGEAEFIKIGAAPTYIKRKEEVETIRSASLPAGILGNVELELAHKKLNSGDFIIMMSDGVYDAFETYEKSENGEAINSWIRGINTANPQQIADEILDRAYVLSGENPSDDMLVLVSKIWKKVG